MADLECSHQQSTQVMGLLGKPLYHFSHLPCLDSGTLTFVSQHVWPDEGGVLGSREAQGQTAAEEGTRLPSVFLPALDGRGRSFHVVYEPTLTRFPQTDLVSVQRTSSFSCPRWTVAFGGAPVLSP